MDKHELILESTLQLVLQEGFYHLNMKKVAKAAGVAVGTIYLYFTSKESLITALYRYVMRLYLTVVLQVQEKEQELALKIQLMTRHYLAFYLQRPDCFSFIQQYRMAPFVFKDKEEYATMMAPLFDLVEQAKQAGILKNLPIHMLLSLVVGPINESVHFWQLGHIALQQPEIQEQLLEACWANVAGPNVSPQKGQGVKSDI